MVLIGQMVCRLIVDLFPFDLIPWTLADALGSGPPRLGRRAPEKFIIARDVRSVPVQKWIASCFSKVSKVVSLTVFQTAPYSDRSVV